MAVSSMKFMLVSVAYVSCWIQFLVATEQSCGGISSCFTHSFAACSADEILAVNSTQPYPVQVTVTTRNPSDTVPGDSFYSAVLTLLCDAFSPEKLASQEAPYCWSATNTTLLTFCDEPGCNNCTSTELVVFDRVSQVSLSSLSVAATLNESSSRLALHFAGLTVVSVSTAESVPETSDSTDLFDVPLVSWVCVGLGVIVALLVLLKPVWWDRLIVKMCTAPAQCQRKSSNTSTPAPTELVASRHQWTD